MTANRPKWWQRLCPKYGNWGGPGWSAGRYNNNPSLTDWKVVAIDAMDHLFKRHDKGYQSGESWLDADTTLLIGLAAVKVNGFHARVYRAGAIIVFSLMVCRLALFGDKRCEPVRIFS